MGQYWSLEATWEAVFANAGDLSFLTSQVYCKVPAEDPALHGLLAGRSDGAVVVELTSKSAPIPAQPERN